LSDGVFGFSSPKQFTAFSRQVDAVFHSAANVNWMLSYEALRPANVTPCLDLIRFCTTDKAKHLFYVSSVSCCPVRASPDGIYETHEGSGDEDWAALLDPYALSKWVGEQVFLDCQEQLNLTIYRPAMIQADSKSGSSNLTDYPNRYVHTCVELGLAIAEPAVMNFTNVDYVTHAMLEIALKQPHATGKAFSITNNASPTYQDLCQAMLDVGEDVKPVSYQEFRRKLLSAEHPEKLELFGLIPMFQKAEPWIYSMVERGDCSNSLEYVEACPKTSGEVLQKWVQFLRETGYLKPFANRCPFCLQKDTDTHMVQCVHCDLWIHVGCDCK
jgi:thioester reductase-like protein